MTIMHNPMGRGLLMVALLLPAALPARGSAQAPSSDLAGGMTAILRDYERVRAALAADDGRPVAAAARSISSRARALEGEAPSVTARLLRVVRDKAGRLARANAGDLPALRPAFGHLSAALIALIEANPELGRGMHVFACPMVDGEGRWLQPNTELENPYMGQRMLQCGRPVDP